MKESAVLDLPLPDKPILSLTDSEIEAIYKASPSGTAKILNNQAEWLGIWDSAYLMKETYKNYLRDLFGHGKVNK